MKKFKIFLTFVSMLISFATSAQLPGYQPYQVVAFIMNGNRSEGKSTKYIKFDGDVVYVDGIGNGQIVSRYIDSGEYSDGNKVYYHQSYNYGTIYQKTGWVTDRNSWLLVSPDRQNINEIDKQRNWRTIYKLQTASSAGSMVY